jgi:hypothetical protein
VTTRLRATRATTSRWGGRTSGGRLFMCAIIKVVDDLCATTKLLRSCMPSSKLSCTRVPFRPSSRHDLRDGEPDLWDPPLHFASVLSSLLPLTCGTRTSGSSSTSYPLSNCVLGALLASDCQRAWAGLPCIHRYSIESPNFLNFLCI